LGHYRTRNFVPLSLPKRSFSGSLKLEFGAGEWPTQWSLIQELHYAPVVNGYLGDWKTGALAEGVYQLRLVVVDKTGNYPAPCQVRVIIER